MQARATVVQLTVVTEVAVVAVVTAVKLVNVIVHTMTTTMTGAVAEVVMVGDGGLDHGSSVIRDAWREKKKEERKGVEKGYVSDSNRSKE